jgi:type IV pilus assembly protein PilB
MVREQHLDLRAATYPTVHGEKAVLRLLDNATLRLQLDSVGLAGPALDTIRDLIRRPEGILLITGPTGSGKTSTLYAALAEIVETGRNVVTIEDPVEFAIPGVSQGQTNERAGFTFAKGLRAILRQDPDVIMVGEIRDGETLETAIEASLTGHLVLSTLHTNSAVATVARLLEMGLERYLLASSVLGIAAQRLVRKICRTCRTQVSTPPALRAMFREGDTETIFRGAGCGDCRGTGFRGRTGLFELLTMTEAIRELVLERAPDARILEEARRGGMTTLREECLALVAKGETTLEEVLRVTPADDIEQGACPVCGQAVEADFTVCPWCAFHLRAGACTNCEHQLQTGWRVCPSCSTPVPTNEGHERRPVLLVADADPAVASSVVGIVEGEYEVRAVRTAPDALEMARSGRVDVLLLDRTLPGGDAADVVRELRGRGGHLPVVLLSAEDEGSSELEQRRVGADHMLRKPLSHDAMRALLNAVVHARAA